MSEDKDHLSQQIFEAKWIANGFPKSGTHLLARMLLPVAPLQRGTEAGYFEQPWAGTFRDNSFSLARQPYRQTTFRLGRVGNGRMIKAHLGHTPDLARFLDDLGAIHVMIYRDLRDVAVSQAYHILNAEDDERLTHPNPDAYNREDFDQLLLQVIKGHERYPALVDRWEEFAPWLDDPWTYCVKFEDLVTEPKEWAGLIWAQAMHKMAQRFGVNIHFDPVGAEAVVTTMAASAQRRDLSPTFRRGESGGWQEEFKAEHVAAFVETGGAEWLTKLKYEQDQSWTTKSRV